MKIGFALSLLLLTASALDDNITQSDPAVVNVTDVVDEPTPVDPMVVNEGPGWMIMEDPPAPARVIEPRAMPTAPLVIEEDPGWIIMEDPPAPTNTTEPEATTPAPMSINDTQTVTTNETAVDNMPMVISESPGWIVTENPPAPLNATEPQAIMDPPVPMVVNETGPMVVTEGPGWIVTESPPVPANTTEPQVMPSIPNASTTTKEDAVGLFTPQNPCAVVRCASSTPNCIVTPQGTATCVANYYVPSPGTAKRDKDPDWWDHVRQNFKGENLQKCSRRGDVPPVDGTSCAMKSKVCFFGNMTCTTVGPYPATRCECFERKWKCSACDCPTSATHEIH